MLISTFIGRREHGAHVGVMDWPNPLRLTHGPQLRLAVQALEEGLGDEVAFALLLDPESVFDRFRAIHGNRKGKRRLPTVAKRQGGLFTQPDAYRPTDVVETGELL